MEGEDSPQEPSTALSLATNVISYLISLAINVHISGAFVDDYLDALRTYNATL